MAIVGSQSIAEAVPGGAATGTWANRTPGSDGDWFRADEGGVFRYSTAMSEWVRPWIYDGSPVVRARLDGDVLPTLATPAWSDTVTLGSVTTDGTEIKWSGVVSDSTFSSYIHGVSGGNHWWQGTFRTASPLVNNLPGRSVTLVDGARAYDVSLAMLTATSYARFTTWGGAQAGDSWEDISTTTDKLVEFYRWSDEERNRTMCIVGAKSVDKATLTAQASDFLSFAYSKYYIGDVTSGAGGDTFGKEIIFGTWT
jgi:hypothetical protein